MSIRSKDNPNQVSAQTANVFAGLLVTERSAGGGQGQAYGVRQGQAFVYQGAVPEPRYQVCLNVQQQTEQSQQDEVQRMDGETRVPVRIQDDPPGVGLPVDDKTRKGIPLWTYMFEYFPDAYLAEVDVAVSGNTQHNLADGVSRIRWDRTKSMDQLNTAFRHLFDYGRGVKRDADGKWHLAKAIWRLKAQLQLDIEAERKSKEIELLSSAAATRLGSES